MFLSFKKEREQIFICLYNMEFMRYRYAIIRNTTLERGQTCASVNTAVTFYVFILKKKKYMYTHIYDLCIC